MMLVSTPSFVPSPLPVPSPAPARPRLRVVQDGAQDCSTCRNMLGCWSPRKTTLSAGDVVSNLLVCRMQRGIGRDRSTRLLLKLIHPKLRKMASWVAERTGGATEDVLCDMESVVVETLLTDYVMGELAPPLVWLFNEKHGGLRHWAVRTVAAAHREQATTVSYDAPVESGDGDDLRARDDLESRIARLNRTGSHGVVTLQPEVEVVEDPAIAERCARALEVVEDGRTLTGAEYRVFKFCLRNSRSGTRMTDWLHRHLAEAMGASRKDVSRLYGIAVRKIIDAVGLRNVYLRARGIEPPPVRRTARARRLSADEIVAAVHIFKVADGRATVLDIAWALDVTDVTVHQLRRRFAGLTPEEVRDILRKKA